MNVKLAKMQEGNDFPYDLFCPTVQQTAKERTCDICNMYFPLQPMVADHKTAIHTSKRIQIYNISKIRPIRAAARRHA